MPIYEYQCQSCNHCFEKLVFDSAEVKSIKCPSCGHAEVKKLMSCINAFEGSQSPFCTPGGSGGFS